MKKAWARLRLRPYLYPSHFPIPPASLSEMLENIEKIKNISSFNYSHLTYI